MRISDWSSDVCSSDLMLDPRRRIFVAAHVGLVRQLEEGEDIAAARVEEYVHIGVVRAGRRHMILGKGGGVGHAEHPLVPLDRLLRVPAAIGGVVDPDRKSTRLNSSH